MFSLSNKASPLYIDLLFKKRGDEYIVHLTEANNLA